MAITLVQSKTAHNFGITSLAITLDAAPTSNNLLIACVTYRSDRTLSPPSGGGWSLAFDEQSGTPGTTRTDSAIYYKVSAGTETTTTWTIDAAGWIVLAVYEFSGCLTSGVLDVTTGGLVDSFSGIHSLSTGTTATGTQASQLVMATWGMESTVDPTGRSYTNSFAESADVYESGAGIGTTLVNAYKVVSSAGAYESTFTWTSVEAPGTAVIAAFNGAASSTTGTAASTLTALTSALIGGSGQALFANADVDADSWTTETGATTGLYAKIGETSPDDTTYIASPAHPSASAVTLAMGDPIQPLGTGAAGVVIRYYKEGSETINLTVRLMEGASVIKTWTYTDISSTLTQANETLTAGEVATIVDPANLRWKYEASSV